MFIINFQFPVNENYFKPIVTFSQFLHLLTENRQIRKLKINYKNNLKLNYHENPGNFIQPAQQV